METHMIVRLVLGLLIIVVALAIAGRRIFFLVRMIASGQPSPGRLDGWPQAARRPVRSRSSARCGC